MRLSHPFLSNPGFCFTAATDLWRALEKQCDQEELVHATRLMEAGLPPVTSRLVLAAVLGINSGLIWSFEKRTQHHYREFEIKKGKHLRSIQAPRVALKIVQKWLSIVFGTQLQAPDHVYGFVSGRSHIDAAMNHLKANWIFSVDIRSFFQTTPQALAQQSFEELGYPLNGARLLASLTCLNGFLAQGAPSSPIISNLCFAKMDEKLRQLAITHDCRLTRYADDIVFSGTGDPIDSLSAEVADLFTNSPWKLAPEKTLLQVRPHRLKVHGLLVDGPIARLTKGYRNKLRTYEHVLRTKKLTDTDRTRLSGHISYKTHVDAVLAAAQSSTSDQPAERNQPLDSSF